MKNIIGIVTLLLLTISILSATSLRDTVQQTLNNNHDILSEKIKIKGYKKYIDQEDSDYKPTLDFEAYIEESKTYNYPKNSSDNSAKKDGWHANLKFEHILYDGGLTPSEKEQYVHQYYGVKYSGNYAIEKVIKETIEAYLDLVSTQELMALSKYNVKTHEDNLEIAKEKEEISGEILETYQVQSKYHFVLDSFTEQENDRENALSLYKNLTTQELTGNICRPIIYEKYIPATLQEAIDVGLRRNLNIKEQFEKIKEQREKIEQAKSKFRPSLKFQLQGQSDYDLLRPEDGKQNIYRARLYVNWNLYEGDKNDHELEQEKIFLREEKKNLDALMLEESDNIREAYRTYFNLKKRVKYNKLFVNDNRHILKIYKKQLEDGTRTFLDILNASAELYRSEVQAIKIEIELYKAYYELLFHLASLSDSILINENQVCPKYEYIKKEHKDDSLTKGLSQELIDIFSDEGSVSSEDESVDGLSLEEDDELNALEDEINSVDDTSLDEELPEVTNTMGGVPIHNPKNVIKDNPIKKEKKIEEEKLDESKNEESMDAILSQLYAEDVSPQIDAKYTINLATLNDNKELIEFIERYNLDENSITSYWFGEGNKKLKIIYGKYPNVKEANEAMKILDLELKQKGIYVDNLEKHLRLQEKYGNY